MSNLPPELQEKYDFIKKSYLEKLADKFERISLLNRKLLNKNFDDKSLNDLYQIIHSLAGSSAVFDCEEISEASYNLEILLKEIIKNGVKLDDNNTTKISELILKIESIYKELIK